MFSVFISCQTNSICITNTNFFKYEKVKYNFARKEARQNAIEKKSTESINKQLKEIFEI